MFCARWLFSFPLFSYLWFFKKHFPPFSFARLFIYGILYYGQYCIDIYYILMKIWTDLGHQKPPAKTKLYYDYHWLSLRCVYVRVCCHVYYNYAHGILVFYFTFQFFFRFSSSRISDFVICCSSRKQQVEHSCSSTQRSETGQLVKKAVKPDLKKRKTTKKKADGLLKKWWVKLATILQPLYTITATEF